MQSRFLFWCAILLLACPCALAATNASDYKQIFSGYVMDGQNITAGNETMKILGPPKMEEMYMRTPTRVLHLVTKGGITVCDIQPPYKLCHDGNDSQGRRFSYYDEERNLMYYELKVILYKQPEEVVAPFVGGITISMNGSSATIPAKGDGTAYVHLENTKDPKAHGMKLVVTIPEELRMLGYEDCIRSGNSLAWEGMLMSSESKDCSFAFAGDKSGSYVIKANVSYISYGNELSAAAQHTVKVEDPGLTLASKKSYDVIENGSMFGSAKVVNEMLESHRFMHYTLITRPANSSITIESINAEFPDFLRLLYYRGWTLDQDSFSYEHPEENSDSQIFLFAMFESKSGGSGQIDVDVDYSWQGISYDAHAEEVVNVVSLTPDIVIPEDNESQQGMDLLLNNSAQNTTGRNSMGGSVPPPPDMSAKGTFKGFMLEVRTRILLILALLLAFALLVFLLFGAFSASFRKSVTKKKEEAPDHTVILHEDDHAAITEALRDLDEIHNSKDESDMEEKPRTFGT